VVSAPLDAEFMTRLARLATDCSATEFMVLLAGYAAFLGRVAGPEVVIGVPFYGRTTRDEQAVGMFVNVLPIRVRADVNGTFRDLVRNVRTLVSGALAHQHTPLQDLVTEVSRTTRPGDHPLTQVCFTHVDDRRWRWAPAGATAVRDVLATGTAKYELLWTVTAGRDSSRSDLEFSTDLFSRGRAEQLHGQLLTTLAGLSTAPDTPIGTVLTGSGDASPTQRPTARPGRQPVHEQVARQARARPAAVAIRDGDRGVTYGELDSAASALAGHLVDLGVRPGERVAVAAGRGALAVTAFLAVVGGGGA
jgi:non-ribosomal peptide synthetase component F